MQGATLTALGPNSLAIEAPHTGTALVRVRYSPYWAVTRGSGCVAPAGDDFPRLVIRRPGILRVGIPDRFVTHGKPALLRAEVGLTPEAIADRVTQSLGDRTATLV